MIIDLSCDLGEATNDEAAAVERELWPLITSANIACGGHVGDEQSMREAVRLARMNSVTVGAHPSYPDRTNFGRKSISIPATDLAASLREQLESLAMIAEEEGARLSHAKPHGALYNDAHHDVALATVVVDACVSRGIAVVTSLGSAVERIARERGCAVVLEGFGDRRYRADGSLQPRSEDGSLLLDPDVAAAQAVRLARGEPIVSAEGAAIGVRCSTICIHSDMPRAGTRLMRIREALTRAGVSFDAAAREM
jgi:UPF0271 protein